MGKISVNKRMIILQYIYIVFFIVLFIYYRIEVGSIQIAGILVYLINHQLRMNEVIRRRRWLFVSSLVIESILAYYLMYLFGKSGGILFMGVCIELFNYYPKAVGILYIVGLLLAVASRASMEEVLFTLIEILPVALVIEALKEQSTGKVTAQELYDELRQKEIELENTNKELESYANTIEEIAVLRERNRISREIHDNVGHALSTIIIQLGAIEGVLKKKEPELSEMVGELGQFAKDSMEDVRAAVRAMKPKAFEASEGMVMLSEMMKNFEKLTGIEVKLELSKNRWELSADEAMVIYRIVQEFLSNALKHGKATKVRTFFNFTEDGLRIFLKDNGKGCDHIMLGNGLKGMKERVNLLGGTLEYSSEPGKGFEMVIQLNKGKLMIDS